MASDEYFIKLGKSIAGPAQRERIEALWKAGKLAETAEVSLDKIHWETIKEFLEGKLANLLDLPTEDEEQEEFEEEVIKPKRSKTLLRKSDLQGQNIANSKNGYGIFTKKEKTHLWREVFSLANWFWVFFCTIWFGKKFYDIMDKGENPIVTTSFLICLFILAFSYDKVINKLQILGELLKDKISVPILSFFINNDRK